MTNQNAQPVLGGLHQAVFSIYELPVGGFPIWQEAQGVVTQDGLFSTLLGSNNLIDPQIFSQTPEIYLGVSVDGESEMMPRSRLAFAPYALYAVNAGSAPAVFHEGGSQTVNLPGDPTDYSVMNGSPIGELGIRDGAITGDKLAIDSVSTAAIRNGAVSQDKLGIGAVGTAELATAAVSQDK